MTEGIWMNFAYVAGAFGIALAIVMIVTRIAQAIEDRREGR